MTDGIVSGGTIIGPWSDAPLRSRMEAAIEALHASINEEQAAQGALISALYTRIAELEAQPSARDLYDEVIDRLPPIRPEGTDPYTVLGFLFNFVCSEYGFETFTPGKQEDEQAIDEHGDTCWAVVRVMQEHINELEAFKASVPWQALRRLQGLALDYWWERDGSHDIEIDVACKWIENHAPQP